MQWWGCVILQTISYKLLYFFSLPKVVIKWGRMLWSDSVEVAVLTDILSLLFRWLVIKYCWKRKNIFRSANILTGVLFSLFCFCWWNSKPDWSEWIVMMYASVALLCAFSTHSHLVQYVLVYTVCISHFQGDVVACQCGAPKPVWTGGGHSGSWYSQQKRSCRSVASLVSIFAHC